MATADGTSVFSDSHCFDGVTLAVRYNRWDKVLSISPNGELVITASSVYQVSDGTQLLSLPAYCPAQAVDPSGNTLYCVYHGSMTTVDLRNLH